MIREPITGPRAWTRRTIRECDWRIAVPSSCLDEIEQLARVLERDPVPTYLLDPADYQLDACRDLLGEVRRRLDEGPGVAVVDRIPIEELSGRPQIEAVFWLLAAMVGRPVVQTLDGQVLLEVTDTGVKKRIGVHGFRTNVAQPPHVDNSFNHAPPDHVSLLCLSTAHEGGASRFVSFYSVHNALLAEHPRLLEASIAPSIRTGRAISGRTNRRPCSSPFSSCGPTFAAAIPTSPSRPDTRRRDSKWTRKRRPRSMR